MNEASELRDGNTVRIGIVAGEPSGDLLGASLVNALKERIPDAEFVGIAGNMMIESGCRSLYPLEKLSVMGIFEILKHLRELFAIRNNVARFFLQNPPDVFIGIDAPEFNLGLEEKLKRSGIPTVHFVSPSVWAWRQGRIKKIARSVDLMLTLFPFEVAFYKKHGVPVSFVGHPLADTIPLEPDKEKSRAMLKIPGQDYIVALLPGSRFGELHQHTEPFLLAAKQCHRRYPEWKFYLPVLSEKARFYVQQKIEELAPDLPIRLIVGQSKDVMNASDAVLLASGTATLEALLLKKPMVVAYKVSGFTYWLVVNLLRLIKTEHVALPNLLAQDSIVEEFIQTKVTPDNLSRGLLRLFDNVSALERQKAEYLKIHRSLRCNSGKQAAAAVLSLLGYDKVA